MFDSILWFHGFLRWLVLALGVAGLVIVLVERVRGREESPVARGVGTAFTAALDLQAVLGLLLLLLGSGFRGVLGHVLVMATAVASAHVLRVRARRSDGDRRFLLGALSYALPLVLILIGIQLLVQV